MAASMRRYTHIVINHSQQRADGVLRTDWSDRCHAAEDLAHATVVPVRCTIGAHVAVLDVVLEDVAPAPRDATRLPDASIFLLFARRVEEHRYGDEAVVRACRADQAAIFTTYLGRVASERRRATVEGLDERHVQLIFVPAGVADDREAVDLRAVGRINCECVDLDEVPR